MKRNSRILAVLILTMLLLCACSSTPTEASDSPALATNTSEPDTVVSSDPGSGIATESPEVTEEPTAVTEPVLWEDIYREFLTDNYDSLMDACLGGMAGVGFIDLDLDDSAELIIFDFGASASMGVQIFDIINGSVECISANMDEVGARFGGAYFSGTYVNAGLFEDFRMMENLSTGERFFCVESGNGALDFYYTELIIFGRSDDALTLSSALYKTEDFDPDSGELISGRYEKSGDAITADEYLAEYEAFFSTVIDMQYEAVGTFIWEMSSYYNSFDGFMAMVENSFKLYHDA